MGLFDGLFDLNHDGKTDLAEQFMAFKMFDECTREDDWKDDREDRPELGIYVDDFDSEDEFDETVEHATDADDEW